LLISVLSSTSSQRRQDTLYALLRRHRFAAKEKEKAKILRQSVGAALSDLHKLAGAPKTV
jgi:hypothetical protein